MDKLTPRQDSFCVHYTAIGAETYSNGTKSAIAAGYSESSAPVQGTRLLKQETIRNRIMELQAENMKRNLITVDKVLADLEHDKLLAREHHQYNVAKGCSELQGKYLAMFTDRNINENTEPPQRFTIEEIVQLYIETQIPDFPPGLGIAGSNVAHCLPHMASGSPPEKQMHLGESTTDTQPDVHTE
ncbi:MAG: terminase small subunit [Planctomycetota bacterium]|jgi:phage terminase small subunit